MSNTSASRRGRFIDRDGRIASRPGMGWEDAHRAAFRRVVKRATAKARRARERAERTQLMRAPDDD